jgi:hypothetical protein
MASGFEFRGGLFDIVDVKLDPGLRDRNIAGPRILPVTGLGGLGQRAEGEAL